MTSTRQIWLIARRELRERSRSPAFRASLIVMVLAVVAVIVLQSALTSSEHTRDVGITGRTPADLSRTIQTQLDAAGTTGRIHTYDDVVAGEEAVRDGDVDVLVVDGQQLEWPKRADEKLQAAVTGAIQLVAVQERAAAAGISPDQLRALVAPIPVRNVELSMVAGRSGGDETATVIMTGMLLLTISIYGALVLAGVVEEKANRVVEVLLTRVPPRALLAGKVLGIGLLGLAQVAATAAAAVVTIAAVDGFDLPAVRGTVLAWAVVWFALGYALYAMLYGALGSLASRQEDAQSVAGPATMVLVASYFAVFFLVAHADSAAARAISYFPPTAPMAMPSRIAMGAAMWWEPWVAVAITLASIVGVVHVGGRLYSSAILHGGPTLGLRDAWRATWGPATAPAGSARAQRSARQACKALFERGTAMARVQESPNRATITIMTIIGVALGVVVAILASDVIIGVIVGSGFIALTASTLRAWTGGGTRHRNP